VRLEMTIGIISMDFVIFILLHFICFVIYTSKYSLAVQESNSLRRKLSVPGIAKESLVHRIKDFEQKANRLKRVSLIIPTMLFLFHVLFLLVVGNYALTELLYAGLLYLGISTLYLIANWIKGAGTINRNVRLPKSPWS
jgi:hypothetical protein